MIGYAKLHRTEQILSPAVSVALQTGVPFRKNVAPRESLDVLHADTDTQVLSNFEDVKMVLALAWQRGRNFDPDLEAFGQILDQMADLRYENGDDGEGNMEGDRLLVQDLQKKYMWLRPGKLSDGDLCVHVSKVLAIYLISRMHILLNLFSTCK